MTDKTNVITVTNENLEWINKNVPGSSKQKRLEAILAFYKTHQKDCVIAVTRETKSDLEKEAAKGGNSVNFLADEILGSWLKGRSP